jgi:hypothetical protein
MFPVTPQRFTLHICEKKAPPLLFLTIPSYQGDQREKAAIAGIVLS